MRTWKLVWNFGDFRENEFNMYVASGKKMFTTFWQSWLFQSSLLRPWREASRRARPFFPISQNQSLIGVCCNCYNLQSQNTNTKGLHYVPTKKQHEIDRTLDHLWDLFFRSQALVLHWRRRPCLTMTTILAGYNPYLRNSGKRSIDRGLQIICWCASLLDQNPDEEESSGLK